MALCERGVLGREPPQLGPEILHFLHQLAACAQQRGQLFALVRWRHPFS